MKGWAFSNPEGIEQCEREGFTENLKNQEGEGCNIYGYLEVNKVAGNFHFAPGKSFQHGAMHVHDLMPFHTSKFNMSHTIAKLSFGADFPGVVNPLDAVTREMEAGFSSADSATVTCHLKSTLFHPSPPMRTGYTIIEQSQIHERAFQASLHQKLTDRAWSARRSAVQPRVERAGNTRTYIPRLHRVYTASTPRLHRVHTVSTSCLHHVYTLSTLCLHCVYIASTPCLHHSVYHSLSLQSREREYKEHQ